MNVVWLLFSCFKKTVLSLFLTFLWKLFFFLLLHLPDVQILVITMDFLILAIVKFPCEESSLSLYHKFAPTRTGNNLLALSPIFCSVQCDMVPHILLMKWGFTVFECLSASRYLYEKKRKNIMKVSCWNIIRKMPESIGEIWLYKQGTQWYACFLFSDVESSIKNKA